MKRVSLLFSAVLMAGALGLGSMAMAQSNPKFIQFKPAATKGALYVPDSGPAPTVAFISIHRASSNLSSLPTRELTKRGFMVLGLNPRSDNNESLVDQEGIALDIKQGVEFLRAQPGIKTVILIGASGGGPSTTYYEAVAENGIGYCNTPEKLDPCGKEVEGLPKADAMVLLDAHPGFTINNLRGMNAAVLDEKDPTKIDPALDPFSPANGFVKDGSSKYSAEFIEKFSKAQSVRMNKLIDQALAIDAKLKAGTHVPPDDDAFIVYHDRARLDDLDTSIYATTSGPQRLLKNDGSIVTEVVKTDRLPHPDNREVDSAWDGGMLFVTVKSFLSANSIRSKHAMNDIDICSSNNSTLCAVKQIKVPMLIMSMNAHYFVHDGEEINKLAASPDKEFLIVDGALHGVTPCTECTKLTGEDYSNVTKNAFDHVAQWTKARFK